MQPRSQVCHNAEVQHWCSDRDAPVQPGLQRGHVFPGAGLWGSKSSRRWAPWPVPVVWQVLAGCPGSAQARWVSSPVLCHSPGSEGKLPSGSDCMGYEACCWPIPNKIWARSSVGINSFSLINFNETTQISTHPGWF